MIFRLTSKKPVLLAGNGVRSSGSQKLLIDFMRKTDIPILTTMNSVDLIQDGQNIGFIGVYGNRIANMIISECDLLISVGARLGIRQVGGHIPEKFAPKADLIRADIDEHELSRNIKLNEEKYLTDAKDFLNRLLTEPIPKYTAWMEQCFEARNFLKEYDNEIGNKCITEISSILPVNSVVAVDVGQNQVWAAQSLEIKGNNGRILMGGGYGSMGCALPYAIGASIAAQKGIVCCIVGDGGLQMNIQELQVLARENLPIKIFVLNNFSLGKISEIQNVAYSSRYTLTTENGGYTVPDFEKVADAYGIKSATLKSLYQIGDFKEWMNDSCPCLINICLPEDTKLIPKIDWNSGNINPLLDESILAQVKDMLK